MKTADTLSMPPALASLGLQERLIASPAALKIGAGVVVLALWEVVVRAFAPAYVATPSGILRAVPKVIVDPEFLRAAATTMAAVAIGLLIAVVLGAAVGLAMGRSRTIEYSLRYYVNSLFTMPMIAVLPLLSLWFGHTPSTRLALIVFVAFFSIVVNVADGARAVPTEYLEVSQSFRSGRIRALFEVILPASTPYLFAGIRLAAGRALTSAVIADFFLAIPGLGYYILYNSRSFHHNEAFVAVIVLMASGVGFDALVSWVSRRLMPWLRLD